MCRIAGLVSKSLKGEEVKKVITVMCNTLQHGGPDDAGMYYNELTGVAFGHRRLSIIDLSAKGHQPMADAGQNIWITFNGEIYNYPELKAELHLLGAVFNTGTDTEVIIQAFLHWGTASFARLRGMFAFALYDNANGDVYLVRDTTGIKPLYYFSNADGLYFASEIKAFKAAGVTNLEDTRWPVWLLAFGHIPEPYTTLKNVLSIPKGHFLCLDKAGEYTIESYLQPSTGSFITDAATAREGLRHHLKTAIRRQLIADAPIGVFLSGGIDSSLLALLAKDEIEQLKTISILFDEKEYDERNFQQAVTSKIKGENFTHLVKQGDFEDSFSQILQAMDMPTTDGINSWFISRYAHQDGLKTVLSGVGADELFGGYPSFNRMKYLRYLKMLPSAIFSASRFFNRDPYKKLSYLEHNVTIADYLFLRSLFTPVDIAKLVNCDEDQVNGILFDAFDIPKPAAYNKLHAAWMETNLYMQNQLLHDTDIMSMSHGLEVRVPFLDEDFQQFTAQIHPAIRFDNKQPKKILIDTFKDILPETVWNRPKMGFTFPLQQWMKDNQIISNEENYIGKSAKAVIENFKKGTIHWSRAYALYQVQGHV
jgi:asparagine synthase (glutamine-hydrolysing)